MKKELKSQLLKCQGCGDDMFFNPDRGKLKCPSCQGEREIISSNTYPRHSVSSATAQTDENKEWANENKAIKCPNCGAGATLNKFETTAHCPYCSTPLVLDRKKSNIRKPDAVIPFKIGKDNAVTVFKQKISKNWLVPGKLKKNFKAEDVSSFYIPSFVFNANCTTKYLGRLYRYKESRGSSSNDKVYFRISGTIDTLHNNLGMEVSTRLEQWELNSVQPYDFSQAKAFTNEYIAGYLVETYSDSVKTAYENSKPIIKGEIQRRILNQYSYDGIDYLDTDVTFNQVDYSYCILPVYRINYTYKNKKYSNIMNGQTGAVGGKLPKAGWKIALCIIIPLLLFALPFIISLL